MTKATRFPETSPPSVYIILLNWNGWRDTIECLESVMRLDYQLFRVVVCDNYSADGSLDHIVQWAQGIVAAEASNPALRHLTSPPIAKPITFRRLGPSEQIDITSSSEKLILVQTGANLGFAGGNNVGLRLALSDATCRFVWLLNNDTVVAPDALGQLIARMQERPEAGICGSKLVYYRDVHKVQVLGGSIYKRWVARIGHIGAGLDATQPIEPGTVESRMQYVVGASMMIRRELLERIGLLDERYFLYFEELDLCTRARKAYGLTYAHESIVYHKEGASIGTSTVKDRTQSAMAQQYASRNRILFTRIHFPFALGTVLISVLSTTLARLLAGRYGEFVQSLKGMLAGLFLDIG
ncbi:MAG: glycosyltransferase family 2 protein [Acidobacteriaceae bacterium]|nr:glycosyltransferase family 2 protein [Acidobacteriaceae bacterium]